MRISVAPCPTQHRVPPAENRGGLGALVAAVHGPPTLGLAGLSDPQLQVVVLAGT